MRDLSIIVPTYNEAHRITSCMYELSKLQPREIIVVDNGSSDNTARIVSSWIENKILPVCDLRLVRLPNPGKGAAVRMGMLLARGSFCYMADCDLSTPAGSILDFLLIIRTCAADMVIGSRRMKGSKVRQSAKRDLSGKVFHALTRILLPDIKDTQCGFKMFTHEAARKIFSNIYLTGLAFDVEVLLEADRRGYKVIEMPVPWKEGHSSRVHVLRDGIKMTRDLWTLAWRYRFKRTALLRPSLP
jgi:dolichyl-phosphate beta-glucosyltransferase